MKHTMFRNLLAVVLVCLLLSPAALADDFNAKLEIDSSVAGVITVTVQDSSILAEKVPTLSIPCDFAYAEVTHNGETVTATLADGQISFPVAEGGDYVITETEAPEEEDNTGSTTPGGSHPGSTSKPGATKPGTVVGKPKYFSDVPAGHWAYSAVSYVSARNMFSGVGGSLFDPDGAMTRGMVMTVLARLDGQDTTPAAGEAWYEPGVEWAVRKGLSDGTMATGSVTREQLVTILYRYAKYLGCDVSASASLSAYPDAGKISDWAEPAMKWAVAEGLINGMDGTLNPQGTATRAQVAAILMRFDQKIA